MWNNMKSLAAFSDLEACYNNFFDSSRRLLMTDFCSASSNADPYFKKNLRRCFRKKAASVWLLSPSRSVSKMTSLGTGCDRWNVPKIGWEEWFLCFLACETRCLKLRLSAIQTELLANYRPNCCACLRTRYCLTLIWLLAKIRAHDILWFLRVEHQPSPVHAFVLLN